jgi:hypothetical protein
MASGARTPEAGCCARNFADKAPNKLAENRSALSAPDTSSVAKCSRLTTSPMHSLTFGLCSVFRIGPHKGPCIQRMSSSRLVGKPRAENPPLQNAIVRN